MAKYTELFIEYVKGGGALPASFDLIDGLKEKFLARFCDCELGFETEELFTIKLELKADVVIPRYAEQITILQNYINQAKTNPTKVHVETTKATYNMGKTKSKMTDLPINAMDATPSSVSESDSYENSDARSHEVKEYGGTDEEMSRLITNYSKKVDLLMIDLLNEFKPLFMAVY